MEYNLSYQLVGEKLKKKKKKKEDSSYGDKELKALMERKKYLEKEKLVKEKKAKLKNEITNLENNKNPSLRMKIASFLSPQANEKRKKNIQKARAKGASAFSDLDSALKPLMDI